jgi:hypothetical protein
MRVVKRQCVVVRGGAVIGRSESGQRRGRCTGTFFGPVRANIREGPGDYRWNTRACNALAQCNELIEQDEDYLRLEREPAERQAAYQDLFRVDIDSALLTKGSPASHRDEPPVWR